MKISIQCECILLQESLFLFLKKYIVLFKDCDFIISDIKINSSKPVFLISKNLSIPFTKEELMTSLYNFKLSLTKDSFVVKKTHNIEKELDDILNDFKYKILRLFNK